MWRRSGWVTWADLAPRGGAEVGQGEEYGPEMGLGIAVRKPRIRLAPRKPVETPGSSLRGGAVARIPRVG